MSRFCLAELNCNLVRLLHGKKQLVPESNQIQGFLKPRKNSPPNSPRERYQAKIPNIIYEFSLVRQKHDVLIAVVPESCNTAELGRAFEHREES